MVYSPILPRDSGLGEDVGAFAYRSDLQTFEGWPSATVEARIEHRSLLRFTIMLPWSVQNTSLTVPNLVLSDADRRKITELARIDRVTASRVVESAIDTYWQQRVAERDPQQAWFWTEDWQAGEREADADIAAGRTTRHESTDEFLAFLDTIPPRDANP
jgi:hypothetical protein